MNIDRKKIEYIAQLANLGLTEKEKDKIKQDLEVILDYVEKLNELNTENIPLTTSILSLENILREDKIEKSLSQQEVLSNAPDKKGGFFKVPKVI